MRSTPQGFTPVMSCTVNWITKLTEWRCGMYGHDEDSAIEYATQGYWAGLGGWHLDKMREAADAAGKTAAVLSRQYDAMTDALRDVAREMDNLRSVRDDLLEEIKAAEAGLEAAKDAGLARYMTFRREEKARTRKGGE